MPRIRVTTPNYPLSHALAKALSDRGYADVVARVAPVERCSVAHRREVSFETISKALQAVEPFQIDSSDVSELDDGIDIDLSFGTSEPLSTWAVTVYTDSRELGSAVCARLNSFGFRVETVRYGAQDHSLLQYGGASGFAHQGGGGGKGVHAGHGGNPTTTPRPWLRPPAKDSAPPPWQAARRISV